MATSDLYPSELGLDLRYWLLDVVSVLHKALNSIASFQEDRNRVLPMPVSRAMQFRNACKSADTQPPFKQTGGPFLRRYRVRGEHKDEGSEFCECKLKVNI